MPVRMPARIYVRFFLPAVLPAAKPAYRKRFLIRRKQRGTLRFFLRRAARNFPGFRKRRKKKNAVCGRRIPSAGISENPADIRNPAEDVRPAGRKRKIGSAASAERKQNLSGKEHGFPFFGCFRGAVREQFSGRFGCETAEERRSEFGASFHPEHSSVSHCICAFPRSVRVHVFLLPFTVIIRSARSAEKCGAQKSVPGGTRMFSVFFPRNRKHRRRFSA